MHVAHHTMGCIHAIIACARLLLAITTAASNATCRPANRITDCRNMSDNGGSARGGSREKIVYAEAAVAANPVVEATKGSNERQRSEVHGPSRPADSKSRRRERSKERAPSRDQKSQRGRSRERSPRAASPRGRPWGGPSGGYQRHQQQQYGYGGRRGNNHQYSAGHRTSPTRDHRYNSYHVGREEDLKPWQRAQQPHVLDRIEQPQPQTAMQVVHNAAMTHPADIAPDDEADLFAKKLPSVMTDRLYRRIMGLSPLDHRRWIDELCNRGAHAVDALGTMATLADVATRQMHVLTNRLKAVVEVNTRLVTVFRNEGYTINMPDLPTKATMPPQQAEGHLSGAIMHCIGPCTPHRCGILPHQLLPHPGVQAAGQQRGVEQRAAHRSLRGAGDQG